MSGWTMDSVTTPRCWDSRFESVEFVQVLASSPHWPSSELLLGLKPLAQNNAGETGLEGLAWAGPPMMAKAQVPQRTAFLWTAGKAIVVRR